MANIELSGPCPRGHDYAVFGAVYHDTASGKPKRVCRECKRENHHRRNAGLKARMAKHPRTKCVNGHDMTAPDAWIIIASTGKRRCNACHILGKKAYSARRPNAASIEQSRTAQILDMQAEVEREPRKWLRDELRAKLQALMATGAILLAMVGCTHPAPVSSPWDAAKDAEAIMAPTTIGTAFAALSTPTPRFAAVHVGPSSGCVLQVGGPVVHSTAAVPIAGRPFTFRWSVEALPPAPAVAVSLLVSLRDLPAPVDLGAAAPGCRLFVHPDYILTPGTILAHNVATGIVTLSWTPPVELVGTIFHTQLVVARPGANGLGHLLSQRVDFEVGTK